MFFLRALKQQKDRLLGKIERERLIFENLPVLSVKLLEIVRDHGRLTVGGAVKATGTNRNTIKDHIRALVTKGHLVRHGAGRGTWYAQT